MSVGSPPAQSVQTRLVRAAKDLHVDANLIFSRYAAERLLHRLASSRHAERFVLKGAMMLMEDFDAVVHEVARFLLPVLSSITASVPFDKVWVPRGPWS